MSFWGDFQRFHLIGIGGTGMCAIAELLLSQKMTVSGSDLKESSAVKSLRSLGARVVIGHHEENLGEAQVVVRSSAVPSTNPELQKAREKGLPIVHRAEILSQMMRFSRAITVAGTHGKTTTASMTGIVLKEAGLEPSIAVGARVAALGGNACLGRGDYFVSEVDESDRSLLRFSPIYAILTNIELEHVDQYKDLEELKETFIQHLNSIPFFGRIVACADDPTVRAVLRNVHRPVITYGTDTCADYSAVEICAEPFGSSYKLFHKGKSLGRIELNVPGRHNVLNSLAATVMGLILKVPLKRISQALGQFQGVERRLERKGELGGVWVLDDYGHHPTEIRASLEACKGMGRRTVLLFQPHRYTRTEKLMQELAESFRGADELFLLDIYSAGEDPIEGVSSQILAEKIREYRSVTYISGREDAVEILRNSVRQGDLLLTMGAGDVWKIGEHFLGKSN